VNMKFGLISKFMGYLITHFMINFIQALVALLVHELSPKAKILELGAGGGKILKIKNADYT